MCGFMERWKWDICEASFIWLYSICDCKMVFTQLVLEAEVWNERLGDLEEEMKLCERSHAGMMEDCANKDERIKVRMHQCV